MLGSQVLSQGYAAKGALYLEVAPLRAKVQVGGPAPPGPGSAFTLSGCQGVETGSNLHCL